MDSVREEGRSAESRSRFHFRSDVERRKAVAAREADETWVSRVWSWVRKREGRRGDGGLCGASGGVNGRSGRRQLNREREERKRQT